MEAIYSSKAQIDTDLSTYRCIPEDTSHHYADFENGLQR
jgi:hypothetical protein